MSPYIHDINRGSEFASNPETVSLNEIIEAFKAIDRSKAPPQILSLPAMWTRELLPLEYALDLNIFLDVSSPESLIHVNKGKRILTVGDAATLLHEHPSTWQSPFFKNIDATFMEMLATKVPSLFLSRKTLLTEGNIIDGNHRLIVMAYYHLFEGVDYPPLDVYWANFAFEHYLNWLRGSFQTQLRYDPKSAIQLARCRLGGVFG